MYNTYIDIYFKTIVYVNLSNLYFAAGMNTRIILVFTKPRSHTPVQAVFRYISRHTCDLSTGRLRRTLAVSVRGTMVPSGRRLVEHRMRRAWIPRGLRERRLLPGLDSGGARRRIEPR